MSRIKVPSDLVFQHKKFWLAFWVIEKSIRMKKAFLIKITNVLNIFLQKTEWYMANTVVIWIIRNTNGGPLSIIQVIQYEICHIHLTNWSVFWRFRYEVHKCLIFLLPKIFQEVVIIWKPNTRNLSFAFFGHLISSTVGIRNPDVSGFWMAFGFWMAN